MRRMTSVSIALVLVTGSSTASAQAKSDSTPWYRKAHSWSVNEENDAFTPIGSDRDYTQGVQIIWNYSTWDPDWNRYFSYASLLFVTKHFLPNVDKVVECQKPDSSSDGGCGSIFFGLEQTIYTPPDLLIPDLQPQQRPYAGYLAAGFGMTARYAHGLVTSQVLVGTTGPHSGAKQIQSLAHWTWSHKRSQPQGWSHQLGNAWQVALVNQYSWRLPNRWMEHCASGCNGTRDERRTYDLTPRIGLDLGTPMTRASAGGVVRLGYGFPSQFNPDRIPISFIPNSSPPDSSRENDNMSCSFCRAIASIKPWGMIFGTVDGRAIAWNQLVSGTYADHGPDGWSSIKQIDTNHLGWEASYGFAVGANFATLVFQQAIRGAEYHPNGGTHRYKSITVTVHSAGSAVRP